MTEPTFETLFGSRATCRGRAPGRVNLIGDHTDYTGGFVMPIATPHGTDVLLAPRADPDARVCSTTVGPDERCLAFRVGDEHRTGRWIDYVAGITSTLRQAAYAIRGFDALVRSTLPLGGGLSSSASLEVALLRALDDAFTLELAPLEVARLAHRAETGFVGAPVGIMDQMAATFADVSHALFLDTRSLAFERLPLPPRSQLLVWHSGLAHRTVGSEYARRRAECEDATTRLGVESLRDLTPEDLRRTRLPAPLDRRVRHVVTENARVLGARRALERGDAVTVGALMSASHASLRDDFEASTPELDILVALAQRARGVFGARLTGAGWGGSVVALADAHAAADSAARVAQSYRTRTGRTPLVLLPALGP